MTYMERSISSGIELGLALVGGRMGVGLLLPCVSGHILVKERGLEKWMGKVLVQRK